MVKKSPFKNVHDVKAIAHKSFSKISPEEVRNCYDHVEEQEILYRHYHNLVPLPVENIEEEPVPQEIPEPIDNDEYDQEVTEMIETTPEIEFYNCDVCGKSFQSFAKLTLHMKSHYQCDKCDAKFSGPNSSRDFKRHVKKHDEPKTAKPTPQKKPRKSRAKPKLTPDLICHLCEKQFEFKSYLERHMRGTHGTNVRRALQFEEPSASKTSNQIEISTKLQQTKSQRKQVLVERELF